MNDPTSQVFPVWLGGEWCAASSNESLSAHNPQTGEGLSECYPVSTWDDLETSLAYATEAFEALRLVAPQRLAQFLDDYATRIERDAERLAAAASIETGLPVAPRLKDVEIPRTVNQLRQAAKAAADGSWALPTIDSQNNIRSCHVAIGPVVVFGPNNFPFAYNAIAGGDFASAIAAGNPVIAKAHPAHPTTTRLLAEHCAAAVEAAGLPAATVQLLYQFSSDDGLRLVGDSRVAAFGFTGSRSAGLALKAACDAVGTPSYLEMSSVNPVVVLSGALEERLDDVVDKFCTSCLMATGQFCTNPGLVILIEGSNTDAFIEKVGKRFAETPGGVLLTQGVQASLAAGVAKVLAAGAEAVAGGGINSGPAISFQNTLLRVSGAKFLQNPEVFQTEMFGNASLFVVAADVAEVLEIIAHLEGNLTGTIFSASSSGTDEQDYQRIAPRLRQKVGRLNDDKMPTGVLVTAAMNHGGPFPATGHAGFTAVGFPACVRRFSMLQCFDGVRHEHLPELLRDPNPTGKTWRLIDGGWSQGDVATAAAATR
ncbi:MAG: aldehyde dehydrogenase (NADP(+)) [Pirellulaceae bacterium]|nr:aldehyde dehydrogenase (NADP(+)) [Pirellulaceae bacterium]